MEAGGSGAKVAAVLKVLNLAGSEVCSLEIGADTSIREVKRHLATVAKLPECLQCLCCGERQLSDGETCGSLGWHQEVTVYLTRSGCDVERCREALLGREKAQLPLGELQKLIASCESIFLSEPSLLELQGPLVVLGNLHGHFEQLRSILDQFGHPDATRYLCLGGYVDRGPRCSDTVALLLLYKVMYPESLFLLRSNHEDPQMNRIYGFYNECKEHYNVRLWKQFNQAFACMPLCALVHEKILCLHGGLSRELHSLEDLRAIARPCAVPEEGLVCDLLWSDPSETAGWGENDRGVSVTFGEDVVEEMVEKLHLELICRSHQVVEGSELFAGKLLTLWSITKFKASHWPERAAVLRISDQGAWEVVELPSGPRT